MKKHTSKKHIDIFPCLSINILTICSAYGFAGINVIASTFFTSASDYVYDKKAFFLGIVLLCMVPISLFDARKEMRGRFNAIVCCVIYFMLSIWAAYMSSWWLLLLCAVETAIFMCFIFYRRII